MSLGNPVRWLLASSPVPRFAYRGGRTHRSRRSTKPKVRIRNDGHFEKQQRAGFEHYESSWSEQNFLLGKLPGMRPSTVPEKLKESGTSGKMERGMLSWTRPES